MAHESAYVKLWRELAARLGADEAAALKARFSQWARHDQWLSRLKATEREIDRFTKVIAVLQGGNGDGYYDSTIARHQKRIDRARVRLAKLQHDIAQAEGASHDHQNA